jgi:tetratricopeptide (TPR) repeat protein
MKKMKKIILLLICSLTIISCSETKQELKRITFTSTSEEAKVMLNQFLLNRENEDNWDFDAQGDILDSILKIDPEFFMAKAFDNFGTRDENRANIISSYENIDKVSEIEAGMIKSIYEQRINGNRVKQDKIIDDLISKNPDYWQLKIISGDIKNELQDAEGSQKRWEEALVLNPKSYEAFRNLAFLHFPTGQFTMLPIESRKLEIAENYLQKIRELYPTSSRPDRYLGNIYRQKNELDQALSAYQRSQSMIKNTETRQYRNGLLMLGHTYTFQGDLEKARLKYIEAKEKALKNKDYQWTVLFANYLSHTYFYERDFAGAVNILNEMQAEIQSFDEDDLTKNWRSDYVEFRKFLAFSHSQKKEETLASISAINDLRVIRSESLIKNAIDDKEKERINLNRMLGETGSDIWYNILFGNYEKARGLLEEFSVMSAKQLSYSPNALDDYFKFSGYLNLMEGKPQDAIDSYARVSSTNLDDDNYHLYFLALANKAAGNIDESSKMLESLAGNNFATWQNAIVKNLAKAQTSSDL